jgi:glycosyltransferase involved in cell wall biosynthesis
LGHVADLRHLYDRGCLAIAPVRYGAGVKIKVLEALTYGVPVVTTSVGAEGMKRELPALNVADRPEDFAAAVVSLLTDPSEWERQRRKIFDLHELWLSHPRPSWAEILDRAQSRRLHDQVWG